MIDGLLAVFYTFQALNSLLFLEERLCLQLLPKKNVPKYVNIILNNSGHYYTFEHIFQKLQIIFQLKLEGMV